MIPRIFLDYRVASVELPEFQTLERDSRGDLAIPLTKNSKKFSLRVFWYGDSKNIF